MDRLIRLAETQDGLVRRDQALALGLAPRTLQRRIGEGIWLPYTDGVLLLRGYPDTRLRRARALLLLDPTLVATGPAALELERGEDLNWLPDGPVWVQGPPTLRRGTVGVTHPAARMRRAAGVLLPAPVCLAGDLGRLLPERTARDVLHRLLQSRTVRATDLVPEAEKLRRHKGGAQFMAIAADLASGSHAESEARLHRLLEHAGITGWQANYRVQTEGRTYYIDVAFPRHGVAIEVDGRAHHSGDSAFENDRVRLNALHLAGWDILHVTWKRLVREPDTVLREIIQALSQ